MLKAKGKAAYSRPLPSRLFRDMIRAPFGPLRAYTHAMFLWTCVIQPKLADYERLMDRQQDEYRHHMPAEQARYNAILRSVADLHSSRDWGTAIEIGCSNGLFTMKLVESCKSVVACDISPVACARTSQRGADFSNLRVEKVDIENDDIDGQYDLLFFMDTLDYIHGRRRIASVCDKLIRIVRPGGYLVFCGCRLWDDCLRNAWWQRWLPEGADQHIAMLADNRGLRLVQRRFHGNSDPPDPGYEDHLSAIFQKCAS